MDRVLKIDPQLKVEPAYYSGGVPVFTPTMAEFRDFYSYNKAINKFGMQSGIVKIIPPLEWLQLLEGTYTHENLETVRIKNPIVQNMNTSAGHQGVFSLQNVEKQRSFNIFQWKELSLKPNFVPPAKKTRRALSLNGSKSPEPTMSEDTKIGPITPNHKRAESLLSGDFNIDVSEFTPERCEELEQLYWKSLGYAEPMYGADMLGSLFLENTTSWNVAQLPNILDLMEEKIPGVNDAYLYAGLWKASFAWHLEDQDLYSINYLHFGAPKQWYSIPQKDNAKFYALMKDVFPEDSKNCSEFLRHKTFLASPQFLAKNGVECNHIIHNQGEFMITYPYGYHAGFNFGFNLAESVNFALDDWFEFAPKTQKCECIHDAVGINYKQLYCKFKGLPYMPEVPPQNVKEPTPEIEPSQTPTPSTAPRKQLKRKPKVELSQYECALCPNNLPGSLRNYSEFELLDTDVLNSNTRNPIQVHRMCAKAFPKYLKIKKASRASRSMTERVSGLVTIPRPLRTLKCTACHIPNRVTQSANVPLHGACFQCCFPKCNRSFHATCALASGIVLDNFHCRQHRSSVSPYFAEDESLKLAEKLETLPIDSMIQFTLTKPVGKRHSGDVFCGLVTKNCTDDQTLQIKIFPSMDDEMEVQYKDVLVGKAESFDNSELLGMTKVVEDLGSPSISPGKRSLDSSIVFAKRPAKLHHGVEQELVKGREFRPVQQGGRTSQNTPQPHFQQSPRYQQPPPQIQPMLPQVHQFPSGSPFLHRDPDFTSIPQSHFTNGIQPPLAFHEPSSRPHAIPLEFQGIAPNVQPYGVHFPLGAQVPIGGHLTNEFQGSHFSQGVQAIYGQIPHGQVPYGQVSHSIPAGGFDSSAPGVPVHGVRVPGQYPPMFTPQNYMGQPRLVGKNDFMLVNKYSAPMAKTSEPNRYRFVEESFND